MSHIKLGTVATAADTRTAARLDAPAVARAWRMRWAAALSVYVAAVLSACGGSPSSVAPAVATSQGSGVTPSTTTSAYGVLATPTVRVAFVPSPGGVSPFLLESTTGQTVTWGGAAALTGLPPTVPFSFPVSACTVDSNDLRTVCIGYASSRIGVMDLSKFATSLQVSDIGVQEFDSGAGSVANAYSGASCVICGVATDVSKQRFIIGGAGGFRVFNYGQTTAAAVYGIPVGENFAFLPDVKGVSYIIAPEYERNGGNRKLRVVDMDAGKVYVWDKSTDSAVDMGSAGGSFVLSQVDAASVDIQTKMIVLSNEISADFMLVDFGQAVFDNVAMTFSAPLAFARSNPATPVARLTDVAISTVGSILLSHGEAMSNIGVIQLPTVSGANGAGIGALGVLDLNDPAFDRTPCGASYVFAGKGDPHGLSLYAGIDNGQRGLVIDASNTCAAILDLVGLRDAAHRPTDPNSIDTSSVSVRAMVRFVKL